MNTVDTLRRLVKACEGISANPASADKRRVCSPAIHSSRNPSRFVEAIRDYVMNVSGSAEKAEAAAGKGFKTRTFEALGAKALESDGKVLRLSSKRLVLITTLIVSFSVVSLYGFTSWSVGYTSSEKFCIGCHEMEAAYRGWRESSHYDNKMGVVASCADCHLPVDGISKMKVKTISGIKDTFYHYFGDPENIDREELAKKARAGITNDSCMRCHKNLVPSAISKGGMIAHRALEKGEQKRCIECHTNLVHNIRPAEQKH